MSEYPHIDVIVVNYRTPFDLRRFLDSYLEFPAEDAVLHIVNVSPTDADISVVREYDVRLKAASTYHHYPLAENVGYGRAVNHAASLGHAQILAIFNADTRLTEGLLEACAYALDLEEDWGVLGPRQVDDAGRLTHAGIFGTLEHPVHRGWHDIDRHQFVDVKEAVTVSGSAYFVKRDVWEELTYCPLYRQIAPEAKGAFLPTPHYYDETWCSYHAQSHGYKVIYYGPLSLTHLWHKSSTLGGWAEKQMPISQQMFREACDHHGIPHD